MNIISTSNYDQFCAVIAKLVKEQIKQKPDSCLGLPAGNTPKGFYQILAQDSQSEEKEQLNWQTIKCFALDDYLDTNEESTFQNFLETHLYRFINLPPNNKLNPRFVDNYDELILKHGGIDLCLLGLGVNGHIAFNEPPTPAASWTHCTFLTDQTREVNKNNFKRAITMGIATIMASKKIVLAVSGERKKDVLRHAVNDTPNANLPASFLTAHKDLLVITDFQFSSP